MPGLPDAMVALLFPFASLFDARTWHQAQRRLGAVRVLGRHAERDFALYH